MGRIVITLAALLCVNLLQASCTGEDVKLDTSGRTSLIGIKKLGVSVVVTDPMGEAGVEKKEIQDEVEIILQKGGLEVVSPRDEFLFVHFRVELFQVSEYGYAL